MVRQAPLSHATFEEFLLAETRSPYRHEFVDGVVFTMAGGTDDHNRLVARVLMAVLPVAERLG
jgi:Uma2 family endonuclease